MQVNQRALLWGGAIGVCLVVVAFFLVPPIYVVLALAVLGLVALVVLNRMREQTDATREADNDSASARLGTLIDDGYVEDRSVRYEEPEQYEEYAEPEAEWTTTDDGAGDRYRDTGYAETGYRDTGYAETDYRDTSYAEPAPATEDWSSTPDDWSTTEVAYEAEPTTPYEPITYDEPVAYEEPVAEPYAPAFEDEPIAFEEYTGPSRDTAVAYEPAPAEPDLLDDFLIEEVDATSVLADEGIIDETKVTSAETILAASQVSRFEPETMSEEESNEETKEILGRVAALLAKYE
jgi:hypothetical protein